MTGGIEELIQRADVSLHPPISEAELERFTRATDLRLPEAHTELLMRSNGIECFDGYERLFGIATRVGIDALTWNEPECWKFAWPRYCNNFWCFGESVWGHQYAYILAAQKFTDPGVYELNAYSMDCDRIASSFTEFVELVMGREEPYSAISRQARARFGPIDAAMHLTYTPPFVLLPRDHLWDLDKVVQMNARAAMICNGDAAAQLEDAPKSAVFAGVTTYADEHQRTRLRLLWR